MERENLSKQKAVEVLKILETGSKEPVGYLNPDKFIQHDLNAADGVEGFEALLAELPDSEIRVNIIRLFQDGEYVFAHCEYNLPGPMVGFEILRFEDGLIVEHWDNLQETAGPNQDGHTMTDGPVEITDIDKASENKELVRNFAEEILVRGNIDKLEDYFHGDNYIQHNPLMGDGLSGFIKAFEEMAKEGITFKYDKIHFILGEGNFVLLVSEGLFTGSRTAFYDLFRIENGKIAEHWDVIQAIPPREEWKNSNGKF